MAVPDDIARLADYQEASRRKQPNDTITEDSAALRFAELFTGKLRYCHDSKAWFEWTGTHWARNRTGLAFQWARDLARRLAEDESKKTRSILSKTSFAAGVEKFAKSDPAFAVTIDTWDQAPWLIGSPAGTVDLRTGLLRPADPAEGITKLVAVSPASTPECPRFMTFLGEATGGDIQLIRFLQQYCGYSLTGITREHALVFIHGGGGEGKTTFVNTVSGVMADYATVAAMDTFVVSLGDKHTTDLAMLRGARLVTASETERGRAWAEARIKALTGGESIAARFMRQNNFIFTPSFKLLILGNHKPVLRNVDEAAKRRFNIVPFNRKPACPDQQLEAKLRDEWPGILRWMIDGCLDWQASGLVRPESVVAATQSYFTDQDLFRQWIEEECEIEKANHHKFEMAKDLYASWSSFAKSAGTAAGTLVSFGEQMSTLDLEKKRIGRGISYRGIRLLRDVVAEIRG